MGRTRSAQGFALGYDPAPLQGARVPGAHGYPHQQTNGPQSPNISTNQQGRKAPNTFRIMDSRTHYKNMLLALLLILAGLAGAIAPQPAAAKKSKFTFDPNTLYVPAEGGV